MESHEGDKLIDTIGSMAKGGEQSVTESFAAHATQGVDPGADAKPGQDKGPTACNLCSPSILQTLVGLLRETVGSAHAMQQSAGVTGELNYE